MTKIPFSDYREIEWQLLSAKISHAFHKERQPFVLQEPAEKQEFQRAPLNRPVRGICDPQERVKKDFHATLQFW